jgi:hypothetical protein
VTFTAAARGFPAPSVQWLVLPRGGTQFQPVSNNLSVDPNSLTLVALAADDGNQYEAVFTSSAGSVTTAPARLTVSGAAPTIDVNGSPLSQSVAAGATVRFTASASGSPAPAVQWQVSVDGGKVFSNIAGATSRTLAFQVQAGEDLFQYRAVFSNIHGTDYTSPATLTVPSVSLAAPLITMQPHAPRVTLSAGQFETFTSRADQAELVQWQVSSDGVHFHNIPGATFTSYRVPAQADQNGYLYRVVFTNPVGVTISDAVALAVYPKLTTRPTAQTVYAGQAVTFTAAAAGGPGLTVQWQRRLPGSTGFVPVANATSNTLTFVAQGTDNGSQYQAVFTSTLGAVSTQSTTPAVLLTVRPVPSRPAITTQPVRQTAAPGQTVSFTAAAVARSPLSVEWYVQARGSTKFVPVIDNPTANTTTLTITASPLEDGNQYYAVFTAGGLIATTNRATLTVLAPPTVTRQPQDLTVPAGRTVSFLAMASGYRVSTQWQVSTDGGQSYQDIPRARGVVLTFVTQAADNGNLYRAVFTNAVGQVMTSAAMLGIA